MSEIEKQLLSDINSRLDLLSGRGLEESVYGILRSAVDSLDKLFDEWLEYQEEE